MRPRLVVPGVIELVPTHVGARHEVVLGELAGYQLYEDVTNWKNHYTFVALADLSLEQRLRFAPRFADVWTAIATNEPGYRDAAPLPHLTALLSRAQLLLVGASDGRDVASTGDFPLDGPHRVFEVRYVRTADDYFHLHARRGKEVLASIGGPFHAFVTQVTEDLEDGIPRRHLADRILRAATHGVVDGRQIALAFMMNDVVDVQAWENHLAALEARAAAHRALAHDVARAIDAGDVELPTYGVARRTILPARALGSVASRDLPEDLVNVLGRSTLELPELTLVEVEADAATDLPAMPRSAFAARPARAPAPAPLPTRAALRAIAVPIVLLIVCALIARCVATP